MEFFLSSMAFLLVVALIVFLIVPRLGATVLVGLSIILLLGCLYSHYSLFSSEYRYSTWQERLKWIAPGVMYTGLGIGVLIFIVTALSSPSVVSILPITNLPSGPTNSLTQAINNTAKVANQTVNQVVSTVNQTANIVGNTLGLNAKNNRPSNALSNLGGLLNTPKPNTANRRNIY
jgi:hypothetical protein